MTGESGDLAATYRAYRDLMKSIGHEVNCRTLAEFLARTRNAHEPENILRMLEDADSGSEAPPPASTTMHNLLSDLQSKVRELLGAHFDAANCTDNSALLDGVSSAPEAQVRRLADAIVLDGHRRFLKPRYIRAAEFRNLLEELQEEEPFSLVKLVPHLQEELRRRGYEFSRKRIRAFFQDEPPPQGIPACIEVILRGLGDEWRTHLVPLEQLCGEEDPDRWLERIRKKLLFRSHCAMHRAIAGKTSLTYCCVHKALSGRRKAKRVQLEIKQCLEGWLEAVEQGQDPDIEDEYRAVPVEWTARLMAELVEQLGTKQQVYELISEQTGRRTGSIRRYFHTNSQLKHAPIAVYRIALEMADKAPRSRQGRSYLADRQTRRVAAKLAGRARAALKQWRQRDDGSAHQAEFFQLRRKLIVAIKEGWHQMPAEV